MEGVKRLMSRLVDERIVQMGFDNKSFESNVKTSISSIDKLKSSLNFSGVSSSLNKNLSSVDTSVLTSSLAKASGGFSAMEIVAISAISNITSRLIELGLQMVKSLSIDNISTGWSKYAEKTTSVATLLSQEGNDIEKVNKQLEKLLWFTDETSYTFTDMVSNISKFTASGQSLEDSVQAMMGIANWAALSGQNASTASRAMYQLSQAMGAGAVKLQDYRSIQNANMDTIEFRQNVLDAAVAAGELQKTITGQYITKSGKSFDISQFAQNLTEDGWFTSNVLMNTLSKYSIAANQLFDIMQEDASLTTTSQAIEKYGHQLDAFGVKAFKSAQEAKTFLDAINSVKEAVGSGWMNVFENIFGGYDTAKIFWTDLANELYDVFVTDLNITNDILKAWNSLGGRNDLFANTEEETGAFWNLFYAIRDVVALIKKSWRTIFPLSEMEEEEDQIEDIAGKLKSFTEYLKEMTSRLIMSEETAEKVSNVFKGLFSIIKAAGIVLSAVWRFVKPIFKVLVVVAAKLFTVLSDLGLIFTNFVNKSNIFTVIGDKLKGALDIIKKALGEFGNVDMGGLIKFHIELDERFKPITLLLEGIGKLFAGLWSVLKALLPAIGTVIGWIGSVLGRLGEKLSTVFSGNSSLFNIEKFFDMAFWAGIVFAAYWVLGSLFDIQYAFASLVMGFIDILDSKALMQYAEAMKSLSIALLIMVVSLVLLASIDQERLASSIVSLGVLMGMLYGMLILLKNLFAVSKGMGILALATSANMISGAAAITVIAVAVLIMALAVKLMSTIDSDKMATGIMGLAVMVGILLWFTKVIGKDQVAIYKGVRGLISLALAVILLVIPLQILGSMEPEQIIRGILGVSALVGLCLMFASVSGKVEKARRTAFGMILFANALLVASIPVKILGSMGEDQLLQGLAAIVGIVAVMAFCSYFSKYVKGAISAAFGVLVFSTALVQFAIVMKIMGTMDWPSILKAGAAILALIIIIYAISKLVNNKLLLSMIGLGVSLAFLSGGLIALAIAMKALGRLSGKDIGMTLAVIAALIVISLLTGLLGILSPTIILFGVSLLFLSAGLLAFGTAMLFLGSINIWVLIKGLFMIVKALGFLAIAAYFLNPLVATMFALSVALFIFAASAFLLASAITMLIVAIGLFGGMIGNVLVTAFNVFIELMPLLVVAVNKMIIELGLILATATSSLIGVILTVLKERGPEMIGVVILLIDTLLARLAEHMPSILESIMSIMHSINARLPEILDFLSDVIVGLIFALFNTINGMKVELIEAAFDLIISFIDAIGESLDKNAGRVSAAMGRLGMHMWSAFLKYWHVQTLLDVGRKIIDNFTSGLKKAWETTASWLKTTATNITKPFSDMYTKIEQVGKDLINGFVKGIIDAWTKIPETLNSLGTKAVQAIKDLLGIKSPSKVFAEIGKFVDLGLAKGISDNSDNVYDSAEQLGDDTIDGLANSGLSGAIQKLNDLIFNGIDSQPVIRPVMDLTEIQNGMQRVNGMMRESHRYSVSGSNELAEQAYRSINSRDKSFESIRKANDQQSIKSGDGTSIVNNFNISGGNPKQIAEEVSRTIQKQIDRRNTRWA